MSACLAQKLPPEVVAHIFSFLSVADQKEAALTCKLWYQGSLDPMLHSNQIIRVNGTQFTNPEIYHRRKGVHLEFTDVGTLLDGGNDIMEQCQALLGPKLLTLSLRGSDISAKGFSGLLNRCPNLVTLDISTCDSILLSGNLTVHLTALKLLHLEDLNLSALPRLSDLTFCRFMDAAPNLKSLNLSSNKISFGLSGLYFKPGGQPNGVMLTLDCILEKMLSISGTLKNLDLSNTGVTNEALAYLAGVAGLQLANLGLSSCKELSDRGLAAFADRQHWLKSISLSNNSSFTDAGISALVGKQLGLRRITLDKCRSLTNRVVQCLANTCPSLNAISIRECYDINDHGFQQNGKVSGSKVAGGHMKGGNGESLLSFFNSCEELTLAATGITEKTVLNICEFLPNLTHLDLSSCSIGNSTVCQISGSLLHLTNLSLAWCKKVSDFGLLGLPVEGATVDEKFDNVALKKVNPHYFHHDPPVKDIAPSIPTPTVDRIQYEFTQAQQAGIPIHPLSKLKHLAKLDLSSCVHVTDASLTAAMHFSELRHLNLEGCYGLTDRALVAIGHANPCLETLHVSRCVKITDSGIRDLLQRCARLRHLVAFGCCKLSDDTLGSVMTYGQKIKYLDVSMCSMTPEGVEHIQNTRSLNVFHHRCTSRPTLKK